MPVQVSNDNYEFKLTLAQQILRSKLLIDLPFEEQLAIQVNDYDKWEATLTQVMKMVQEGYKLTKRYDL